VAALAGAARLQLLRRQLYAMPAATAAAAPLGDVSTEALAKQAG
jgi:hypothetical protein